MLSCGDINLTTDTFEHCRRTFIYEIQIREVISAKRPIRRTKRKRNGKRNVNTLDIKLFNYFIGTYINISVNSRTREIKECTPREHKVKFIK
jgi:hypothetical protein